MNLNHNKSKLILYRFVRILIFVFIIVALSYGAYRYNSIRIEKNEIEKAKESVADIPKIETPKENATNLTPIAKEKDVLPEKAMITMPFTTQSPLAVWDATQEEACEEASIIMVAHYLNKTTIETKAEAEKEILDLIFYEEKNGYGPSITLSELNIIAKKYYNLTGKIETDISIDDIKKEIALGNPVIVPAAGKILPNPNFRNGGPVYHMLVIKGYDKNGFITNDPGTRLGENFRYTFNDLINAIHDWNSKNILDGRKAYITLTK